VFSELLIPPRDFKNLVETFQRLNKLSIVDIPINNVDRFAEALSTNTILKMLHFEGQEYDRDPLVRVLSELNFTLIDFKDTTRG
jgi:hypothetical protein